MASFEWQLELETGEWVSQKFEKDHMPSPITYKKAVLVSVNPLEEVLKLAVVEPASFGNENYSYWAVVNE